MGSDHAASAVLTVAAGLTDGPPVRVDWRDAGPCHAGHSDFGFYCSTTHTHTRHRARGEGEEGVDRKPQWAVSVQHGTRLSPAVTSLVSDAPQEGFWRLLGPEGDGLAMSAEGADGGSTLEPLLFQGSRQAGLGPWTAPLALGSGGQGGV